MIYFCYPQLVPAGDILPGGMHLRLLVIIPAFNEEKSVGTVIRNVKSSIPEADILVINDGSCDSTQFAAVSAGADVINLPFNLGIGGAMQTGYMFARKYSFDIAIQVDGDGQHDPSYIRKLIAPIEAGTADMAIGSRYIKETSYKSTAFRRMGMVFFSALVNLLTGRIIKDTTSGFRAVNRRIINYFANYYPSDYPEVDVLVKLFKLNARVVELPVEMSVRQGGKSSITPVRSIYYMIKVSLSLIIGAMRTTDEYGGEPG
jgi:glycosyltransferase involved in cell wall biosynthesis